MKNLKRALSLALSAAMVLGMMVVGSGAADAAKKYDEPIGIVNVLEIMKGDENGNFNGGNVLTRNEMAVVMCNLAGLKLNGAHPFTDVPAWADKYVGALYTNGLTSGTSATTYGGSANVTTTEAALMIMKTLGYFEYQGEFGEDWALATVKKATELKLFKDIDAGVKEGLTRAELAQMIVTALDKGVYTVDEYSGMKVEGNGMTVEQKPTYGYNYTGEELIQKLFNKVSVASLKSTVGTKGSDEFGRPAATYSYKNTEKKIDNEVKVVETADHVLISKESQLLSELLDDKKLEFTNFNVVGGIADRALAAGEVVELFVNEDDDDLLDSVVTYTYIAAEVEEVKACDADVDEDEIADGAKIKVKFDIESDYMFDIQLKGLKVSELKKGDYVAFATQDGTNPVQKAGVEIGKNDYTVYYGAAQATKVSGKATSVKGTEFVKIDDVKYLMATGVSALTAGKTYNVYTDPNGFVLASVEAKDETKIDDVYLVVDAWSNPTTDANGVAKTVYKAQLVNMKGETSVIDLESGTFHATSFDGKLVTISDKKDTVNNCKANDGKYDLTLWTGETDVWNVTTMPAGAIYVANDDTRITISGDVYRLNADTKYILVGDKNDDIVVTTKVGGVDVSGKVLTAGYAICDADNASVVSTLILVSAAEIKEDSQYSEDLIFIKSASTEVGDGYVMQTVYFADGTSKVLKIADDQTITRGFFKYSVNKDGYYEIDSYTDAVVNGDNGVWKDDKGVIVNATVTDANDLFNGNLLTVGAIKDIKVGDAKFVDAHSKTGSGQYTKGISSLKAAFDLLDRDVVTSLQLSLNVAKDGAVVVILTSAPTV